MEFAWFHFYTVIRQSSVWVHYPTLFRPRFGGAEIVLASQRKLARAREGGFSFIVGQHFPLNPALSRLGLNLFGAGLFL